MSSQSPQSGDAPGAPLPEVDLEMDFHFAAAHRLPRYNGRCFNLHGHNYELRVGVRGRPDAYSGILVDFGDLEKAVKEAILDKCDHAYLNEFIENPTAENIVVWMWARLQPLLPQLFELRLWEVKGCCVVYRGGQP
jgi:6-pyruvoyltetrahydropterin/6-carboxytetrahydropterin synthase